MKTKNLVTSALLCAIAIVIPMFFPKILIEPASFTLASHVPIFIAMFLSPSMAIAVSLGSTLGFLLGGLPIVVVLRAFTHVIFAFVGAKWLEKANFTKFTSLSIWALVVSVLHGIGEFLIVTIFYFGGGINSGYYSNGYFVSVVVLVLLGTIIHSMVDFILAFGVAKALKIPSIKAIQNPFSQIAKA